MHILVVEELQRQEHTPGIGMELPEFKVHCLSSGALIDGPLLDATAAVLLDAARFTTYDECVATCRRLSSGLGSEAPVLLIGPSTELPDKLMAFDAGADDYLARPFDRAELIARLRALGRRRRLRPDHVPLQVADLCFDPRTCEVRRAGRVVSLGPIGRQVLHLLLAESPRVVTRERLERAIWGDAPPQKDLLRSHMSMLRKAIDAPHAVKLLQTVHGTGFRLIG